MEFAKVVALSWLPFKLDVYVSCCEALVNRGKILPSSPPTPQPPQFPLAMSILATAWQSHLSLSLSLSFFVSSISSSGCTVRGVYGSLQHC